MSFITGSRAYGQARPSSDVDLAVLVDHKEAEILRFNSEAVDGSESAAKESGSFSLRYGKLNLLVFTNSALYNQWKEATDELKWMAMKTDRPVSRDRAVQVIKEKTK